MLHCVMMLAVFFERLEAVKKYPLNICKSVPENNLHNLGNIRIKLCS